MPQPPGLYTVMVALEAQGNAVNVPVSLTEHRVGR
jgi:hypothetical protein